MNKMSSSKSRLRARLEIWWEYEKWYWAAGAVILYLVLSMLWSAFGWGAVVPDVQVGVVSESLFPAEYLTELTELFERLAGDRNQDGKVIAQVNVYFFPPEGSAFYEQRLSANVRLIGDLEKGELLFFLTDDAKSFEANFGVLAGADGSCLDKGSESSELDMLDWRGYALGRNCQLHADGKYSQEIWAKLQEELK